MITDLKIMMEERLRLYQKHKRTLPRRIIVYRDGVSEGQFNTVVEEELPEMIKSFAEFSTPKVPYRPKLTIVICGKRHHTRFYPAESQFADQNGNPKPGTVVDRGITAVYGEWSLDNICSAPGIMDNPQISISSFRRTTVSKAQSAPLTIMSFTMKSGSRRTSSRLSPTLSLICSLVLPKRCLSPPLLTTLILPASADVRTCTSSCKAYKMLVRPRPAEQRTRRN